MLTIYVDEEMTLVSFKIMCYINYAYLEYHFYI